MRCFACRWWGFNSRQMNVFLVVFRKRRDKINVRSGI